MVCRFYRWGSTNLIGSDTRGKYTSFFRFMIGLHIDDKPLLELIRDNL